jgi:NAD(P)-dependent dehydrogenase (short-subunit alcohol dehydrogenase family)
MLKAELVSTGARVVAAPMDVTSVASIRSAFDAVEAELGAGAVCDIVVNNAGIAEPKLSLQVTEEDWDGVVDTNLRGAFFVAQEGAKRMVAAGVGGSIINIASILGLRPGTSQANYGAAKAGLVHVTKVGWWAHYSTAASNLPKHGKWFHCCPYRCHGRHTTKTMALELTRQNIRVNALAPVGRISRDFPSIVSHVGRCSIRVNALTPTRDCGLSEELTGLLHLLLLTRKRTLVLRGTSRRR